MSEEQERPAGWDDDERVRRWIEGAKQREAQMAPISEALFDAADLRPGENVLDVGVGTGPTSLQAARAVGADGRVVGADVSPPMIEVARAAAAAEGVDSVDWVVADAQSHDFGAGAFDAVISRFGVMFFPDPAAAFGNLAQATRPGGRLAMAVWQTRDHVPLFELPYQAAVTVLERHGLAYEPIAPDALQCSLGTPEVVRALLEPAGWHDIDARPTDRTLYVGGEFSVEQAAREATDIGPIRMLLEGQPDEVRDEVRAGLVTAFAPRFDGTGVALPGGFMIVTARR